MKPRWEERREGTGAKQDVERRKQNGEQEQRRKTTQNGKEILEEKE